MISANADKLIMVKSLKTVTFVATRSAQNAWPRKGLFQNNKEETGNVCIVCDRKFYIYSIFKDYIREANKLDNELK